MKIYVDFDEWYPVYYEESMYQRLETKFIEVTKEEYLEYKTMQKLWDKWQEKLEKAYDHKL